ncbi:unnamed protein product [Phaeothamnion confervicola]
MSAGKARHSKRPALLLCAIAAAPAVQRGFSLAPHLPSVSPRQRLWSLPRLRQRLGEDNDDLNISAWDEEDRAWLRGRQRDRGVEPVQGDVQGARMGRGGGGGGGGGGDDGVDGPGMMRTSMLWALLHGPYTSLALPAMFLYGRGRRGGERDGGGMFSFVREKVVVAAVRNKAPRRGNVDDAAIDAAAGGQVAAAYAPRATCRASTTVIDGGRITWRNDDLLSPSAATAAAANGLPHGAADACPCGSGSIYKSCCEPLHAGKAVAETPTQLLQARFSAYALQRADFLVASTARGSGEWRSDRVAWLEELEEWSDRHSFLGIDIGPERYPAAAVATAAAAEAAAAGCAACEVVFTANLLERFSGSGGGSRSGGGEGISFTERSCFVRERGAWFYSGGDLLQMTTRDRQSYYE